MASITICLLTHNSMRTLASCLAPTIEMVVVDSGSSDGSLKLLQRAGIEPIHRPYASHGDQMNFAIEKASNDWVLCLDSDEIQDAETVSAILGLKPQLDDPAIGYRIRRHRHALDREVRAIFPVSSPDRPLSLFNRPQVRFNDQPVDDKASGAKWRGVLLMHVIHDTFISPHELSSKLNGYTTRLVQHQEELPPFSQCRAFFAPPICFHKEVFPQRRLARWRNRLGACCRRQSLYLIKVFQGLVSFATSTALARHQ